MRYRLQTEKIMIWTLKGEVVPVHAIKVYEGVEL